MVQERRSYCTAGLCDAKAYALHGLHLAMYHLIGMQKRWRQGEGAAGQLLNGTVSKNRHTPGGF